MNKTKKMRNTKNNHTIPLSDIIQSCPEDNQQLAWSLSVMNDLYQHLVPMKGIGNHGWAPIGFAGFEHIRNQDRTNKAFKRNLVISTELKSIGQFP